jgi:hypothetical protein
MQYKLYRYQLNGSNNKEINPDRHFQTFDRAKGPDLYGELVAYRGKKDALVMHLRNYGVDFIGLIGRHSTEREVTAYDPSEDLTAQVPADDDDYPHAAFVCLPRMRMIACTDAQQLQADTAMSRLHQILAAREHVLFIVNEIKETFDLRRAVNRFRVVEVVFEILPVNPHTDDLGEKLDESRKLDHIRRLNGVAHGSISDPIKLEGGVITAVQQLQQSGHAKAGFKAFTLDKSMEIQVPKPTQARALSSDPETAVYGDDIGVRIKISEPVEYPFSETFVHKIRGIASQFLNPDTD